LEHARILAREYPSLVESLMVARSFGNHFNSIREEVMGSDESQSENSEDLWVGKPDKLEMLRSVDEDNDGNDLRNSSLFENNKTSEDALLPSTNPICHCFDVQ
jgi:hypothetical protein